MQHSLCASNADQESSNLYNDPIISRDKRVVVTSDVKGNLGAIDVVVQNPPGNDWLKDRLQDVFTVLYTSGTTGHPKGAMQSHRAVILNGSMTSQMHMRNEKDIVVSALPCPHVYGNVVMTGMMMFGTKLVLHKVFDAPSIFKDIEKHKATIFDGVPTMFMYMIDHPDFEKANLKSLTRCYVGGQTMPVAIMENVEKKFKVPLIELWGMTEIAGLGSTHPLYGNYGQFGDYLNPYADLMRGYKDESYNNFLATVEIKQNLDFVTGGLNLRFLGNTSRYSFYNLERKYNPFYYSLGNYDFQSDTYSLVALNPNQGTEYLEYSEGNKIITNSTYFESAIDYNKTINEKHEISGMLIGIMRELKYANAGNLQSSLPFRNLGVSGRFTYAFDGKYFSEFNFGYNGSERFAKNERFGFFPSTMEKRNKKNKGKGLHFMGLD